MVVEWLIALVCAVACGAIPWVSRSAPTMALVIALVIGVVIAIAGSVLTIAPFPLTDVVVWLIAVSGGLALGRVMPPRFWPYLALLLTLSALDIFQITLTSRTAPGASTTMPPAALYGNFRILLASLPNGHFNIGLFDLLILIALSENWRRRGAFGWYALATGATGLTLAYLCLVVVGVIPLPLIPFITVGWLIFEGWYAVSRARHATDSGRAA